MAERKNSSKKQKPSQKIGGILIAVIALIAAYFTADNAGIINHINSPEEIGDGVIVSYIDVGQGDSILIQTSESNILIDAGETEYGDTVVQYLKEKGVTSLDYMISTHPHSDHMGGLAEVLENIDTENIILPELPDDIVPTTKTYENFLETISELNLQITPARSGDIYNLGSAALEILAPISDDYNDLNDFSVVVELTCGENTFLFTGDASSKSEKDMLEAGVLGDIDVLKVGHHGSSTSSKKKFLEAIKPDYAVIMCGEGNSYNHPNADTVERLSEYTENIYRTDQQGNIVITSNGTDINVTYDN